MVGLAKEAKALGDGRVLLGVAGPPGAGKSTFAARLAATIGPEAVVAPMDGFHRSHEDLERCGLHSLKGIPESFNAEAFVGAVEEVRSPGEHSWPAYDRSVEKTAPGAISINAGHRLVIVEGNYLLLPTQPWVRLQDVFDAVWYLDVDLATIRERLIERQQAVRSLEDALAKVESTDLPNARLVAGTKHRAHRIIDEW